MESQSAAPGCSADRMKAIKDLARTGSFNAAEIRDLQAGCAEKMDSVALRVTGRQAREQPVFEPGQVAETVAVDPNYHVNARGNGRNNTEGYTPYPSGNGADRNMRVTGGGARVEVGNRLYMGQ